MFRTATTHFVTDQTFMLAVQGRGTETFQSSGAPALHTTKNVSVVLTGTVRVTRLASGDGYNFLLTGVARDTDRKRMFFRPDALVHIGSRCISVETYFAELDARGL